MHVQEETALWNTFCYLPTTAQSLDNSCSQIFLAMNVCGDNTRIYLKLSWIVKAVLALGQPLSTSSGRRTQVAQEPVMRISKVPEKSIMLCWSLTGNTWIFVNVNQLPVSSKNSYLEFADNLEATNRCAESRAPRQIQLTLRRIWSKHWHFFAFF